MATSRRANAAYTLSEEEALAKYHDQFRVKKDMPAAFAELQGDYLYMLTTPSREVMDQMIHTLVNANHKMTTGRIRILSVFFMYSKTMRNKFVKY